MSQISNKRKNVSQGFTLIELLIVISIIAFLSSVIMVVVQDARNKGKVSKVKADMIQIRNAAEIYKTNTGSYPTGVVSVSGLIPNYLPVTPTNPFGGGVYVLATEDSWGGWCVKNIAENLEQEKLYVYLSLGSIPSGVKASDFNNFRVINAFGLIIYNGSSGLPFHPCIE